MRQIRDLKALVAKIRQTKNPKATIIALEKVYGLKPTTATKAVMFNDMPRLRDIELKYKSYKTKTCKTAVALKAEYNKLVGAYKKANF